MNIKLSQKIIKEMCGTISFKRGEAFYRANKVQLLKYTTDTCEAIVTATEDMKVNVINEDNGGFRTNCTCPSLASFQKECQHVAAVLLAIYDQQRQRGNHQNQPDSNLTKGLISIFQEEPKRSIGHQLHFEDREVLETSFMIVPIEDNGKKTLGVELQIGELPVLNIRDFLEQVRRGNKINISRTFIYDPTMHCFQKETDTVMQKLIQINHDEIIYKNGFTSKPSMLLIPPSAWKSLLPLLTIAPSSKLQIEANVYNGIVVSKETLPLKFELEKAAGKGYELSIRGMDSILILSDYHCILHEGRLLQIGQEDCKRLENLKVMLDTSKTKEIPITDDQIHYFLKKILPGLKKLGIVTISEEISNDFVSTQLVAKLFLDRVKNRLLVGLEFHYGNTMINPLAEVNKMGTLIRDTKKEERILEIMEDSELAKTDGGYFLHNEELEYEFLYHVVPKLQELVQVYATTAVRNRIFKAPAGPNIRVKVKKERTNWLEFKFEMDGIPEREIRDLLQALEEKRKFYRVRNGSLLSLETKEFEEIQRFLKALPVEHEELEKELEMPILKGISFLDSIMDSKVFTPEESFRQFLEQISNPVNVQFEVPANLSSILRDYQKQGYQWMKTLASYGFGGILADDMGLGKTLQSITYIQSVLPNIRKENRPILIVCPSSVTYNWLNEFTKFTPELQAIVVDGGKKERQGIYTDIDNLDVLITSYTLLRKDIHWFESHAFHTVFFDEAQAFKNPITQTARAVKKIKTNHRFALTGTPVENTIEELWSIFHIVFPELFQGLKQYSNLTRKQIARRAAPFLLRRLKEDILTEVPEKIELQESVELLPEQKKLYAAYLSKLRHDTLKHLNKDTIRKNRIKILAGLTRLRQICCHPTLFVDGYQGSSAKFDKLMQIVQEAKATGRRVLIFSQFTKMLELIGRELAAKELPFFYLDGQTPSEERVEICNRFNEGEHSFFLISLKAGGTGLNLTGADTVILYDLWWNPAVEEQAADRAHRMGQKQTVQVIKLIARGTIEEKMDELQVKKRHLIEEIIDSNDKGTSTLTEEDLRELLMLEQPQVK